jgi:nitrogenase molybdenum-iron protein alpha/beta subunit
VHDVNLIGEYNIAGEFWHVAPLFDELGLRILCTLSGDARFHEVQTMHRAKVSIMVVCAKALLNVARKLEDNFGVPFFEGSFYGVPTPRRRPARLRPADRRPRPDRAHRGADRPRGSRIRAALEPWRERLRGKRVLLYTGGVKSWSIVSALQDLGMKVVATGTKKSTEEDKARIRELMGDDTKMIDDGSPKALLLGLQGLPGRHPDRRRPQPLHGAEGAHSLPRHQPGTRIRLRRLRRHARTGAAAGADPGKPGLVHGSQGCTAFGKVFLVRHFREPIPLQTTAMDQVSSIMSADENVIEGLRVLCEKNSPESSACRRRGSPRRRAATSTAGARVPRPPSGVRGNRRGAGEHPGLFRLPGIRLCAGRGSDHRHAGPDSQAASGRTTPAQVNVLASSMLTPGDIEAIKAWIEAFGLQPLVLPDIGDSLDGHLVDQDTSPLTLGGTPTRRPRDARRSSGHAGHRPLAATGSRSAEDAHRRAGLSLRPSAGPRCLRRLHPGAGEDLRAAGTGVGRSSAGAAAGRDGRYPFHDRLPARRDCRRPRPPAGARPVSPRGRC